MKSITSSDRKAWLKNIDKLKAYRKKYGDFHVPFQWKKDRQFAQWVENICKHPKQIPGEFYNLLVETGFDFRPASGWEAMFHKLGAFYEDHGHSYVLPGQKGYEGLYEWTVKQRTARPLLTPAQIKKLDSLGFDWEASTHLDIKWELRYQELVNFKKQYGHTRVPQNFKENTSLGNWVYKQRANRSQHNLARDKIKKLNELGFLWKEDIARMREDAWEKRYQELVRYKKVHGHIDRLSVRKDHYQLGLWIETQLTWQDKLSPSRKKKLDAVGFRWDKGDIYEERWNAMYQKLRAHVKKHGHCRVRKREDFRLSVWLQRQKRDKAKLPPDKKKKLEQLGIKWPGGLFRDIWEGRYKELKAFKKTHGHLAVSKADRSLYDWIQDQKKLKKENRLPKEREEKLRKLDFTWTGEVEKQKLAAWHTMYKKFRTLKEKHGDRYHLKLKDDPALDWWVNRQLHNKLKLSAYKRQKLDAIGFAWNRSGYYLYERWEKMYEKLKAYKKKYGHCDVPQSHPDQSLARWVNSQRNKPLSKDKKDKLNKLGFSWANEIKEKRWLQRVKEFTDLKKKGRKAALYTPLYSWLYQQRKNFHKLPAEKKKMLLRVGIVKR